ncbi:MAG: porin [Propylenella sp.]
MTSRHLALGAAAFVAAVGSAQAADLLPTPDYQYMRICDAFGERFYYIPGTDTCLQVGGYVRAESHWVDGDPGLGSDFNNWTSRGRGHVLLDARTQTDFGLVRAYVALQMTVGLADTSTPDPNYDGTDPELAAAYIQISRDWITYTAGHTGSFFDFFGSHGYGTRILIDDNTGEQTLFALTFTPGMNGLSFTLSAEDPASGGRRFNGADDYEGQEAPDGVANIRYDGAWGSAAVMGVVRHIHDVNGDGIGWAGAAGVSINLPGDWTFDAQGGYTEGALAYLTTDPGGAGDFEGPTGDDKNIAWLIRGGFNGPVMPNVTVWADGSFTHVEQQTAAAVEYDFWAVQVGAAWEPVPGLAMGPEFAFNRLDFDAGGADQDVWGVMWRVQRDF